MPILDVSASTMARFYGLRLNYNELIRVKGQQITESDKEQFEESENGGSQI